MKTFLLPIYLLSFFASESWTLLRDEDNIRLYTRPVSGYEIQEVKAITTVNAPIEVLQREFRDIEGYVRWFDECLEADELKKINENEVYARFLLRVPFPFQNRDIVTRLKFQKVSPTAFTMKSYNAPAFIGKKKRIVRVPHFKSEWFFESIENNTKTRIVTTLHADMGGYIPTWAINSATMWGPFLSLKKLRALVEKEQEKGS